MGTALRPLHTLQEQIHLFLKPRLFEQGTFCPEHAELLGSMQRSLSLQHDTREEVLLRKVSQKAARNLKPRSGNKNNCTCFFGAPIGLCVFSVCF